MPSTESSARPRGRRCERRPSRRSMRPNILAAMRWLLISALLLTFPLAFPLQAQETPEWFVESFLDLREDAAEAARDGRRLMVYFHQDGCPYCKQLVTVNFRDPKIVEKTRRHFMPLAINIWGDREVTAADGRKLPEKAFARLLKIQ